jgi:hypothetical protein
MNMFKTAAFVLLTTMAGGRALIPKNALGWPILAVLFLARVGLLTILSSP